MTRVQILTLAILAILVCIVFAGVVVVVRPYLTSPPSVAQVETESTSLPPTSTWTPIPTSTDTPTPADTPLPTPTYTRVVMDTATPTPSPTPLPTPTATITPTPTKGSGGGSGGGSRGGPRPTPTPTSRYPLTVVEEPLTYETDNHMFVILAIVTSGDLLLPDYRMVGTHSPSGAQVESEPSCDHLCRGSGPDPEVFPIQEGNLVFEAFFYDTGTWSLTLLDPQGQQASEVLEIEIDIEDRYWFYYHFNR